MGPLRTRARCAAIALIACGGGSAPASVPEGGWPLDFRALRPIDHLVADRDPLAASMREQSSDLLIGTGYGKVYQDPSNPNLYVRRDGAMYAVSSETLWAWNRNAVWPVVAPGTVFYIGEPWRDPSSRPRVGPPADGAGRMVSAPVTVAEPMGPSASGSSRGDGADARRAPMLGVAPAVAAMSDEAYRRSRLWEIARSYGATD